MKVPCRPWTLGPLGSLRAATLEGRVVAPILNGLLIFFFPHSTASHVFRDLHYLRIFGTNSSFGVK